MPVIRYPGSKAKFISQILPFIPAEITDGGMDYAEPYIGSGAVAFALMANLPNSTRITLGDADAGIVALWRAVQHDHVKLQKLITSYVPKAEDFYAFKEADVGAQLSTEHGFRELVLHQISYSGLGAMSGGPLGGKNQASAKYPVGCRWNGTRTAKAVGELHDLFARFPKLDIRCQDALALLKSLTKPTVAYLDPPYYEQGPALYKYAMTDEQHVELAAYLKTCPHQWLVSYDAHPRIRELYSWARIINIGAKYTMGHSEDVRPLTHEVLVVSGRKVRVPMTATTLMAKLQQLHA